MATPRETFQTLLRELFQFDLADLDFGTPGFESQDALFKQLMEAD